MSAKNKGYLVTAVIALIIALIVVWASNNVGAVKNKVGSGA